MSHLTAVLNRLLENLAYHGEPVDKLRPGLSREEIDRILSAVGLASHIPPEVYELYQWRDGVEKTSPKDAGVEAPVYLLPFYRMIPLQKAVWDLCHYLDYETAPSIWHPSNHPERLLPILACGEEYHYKVQIRLDKAQSGTPGTVFEDPDHHRAVFVSNSLLGFFTAVVECWEEGIYTVNPDPSHEWDAFQVDEAKQRRVFRKYRNLVG